MFGAELLAGEATDKGKTGRLLESDKPLVRVIVDLDVDVNLQRG
jgi:hypothetical protein